MDRFTKIATSIVIAEEMSVEPVEAPSRAEFDRALDEFIGYVNALIIKHTQDNFSNLKSGSVSAMHGQKYVRLVRADSDGGSRSAYGDVMMAAGWSAPAKHPRANIFDKGSWKAGVGPYGMAYLK